MAPSTNRTAGNTFTSGSVHADGFVVRYLEAGTGDPVVRIHGAGGPLISDALADLSSTHRVIELELPGFGSSPVNDRTTGAASMADTVAAVIDELQIAPVPVWGTSMGGVVATHLAVRHPDKVRSLVLEAPGLFRIDYRNPAELSGDEFVRAFNTHPERVADRERQPLDPTRWELVVRIMGPDWDHDLETKVRSIPFPTLVLWGAQDGIFRPTGGNTFRDAIPHCALVVVDDAAHDLQGDQPDICVNLVRRFLEEGTAFTDEHS